ncbi:hypothetical protein D9M68_929880 [compost metagenome]
MPILNIGLERPGYSLRCQLFLAARKLSVKTAVGQADGTRQFTNTDAIDSLFPVHTRRGREDCLFVRGGLVFRDFHETAPVARLVSLKQSFAERLVLMMLVI